MKRPDRKDAPKDSGAPVASARSAALAVLGQVLHRRQPLDLTLTDKTKNGGLNKLEPRDRAFARNLVATVLRRLGQIDQVLSVCVERPIPDAHRRVHDVLRLGAAQILFLGTPPHAAVDRTVALVPRRSGSFRGLVNAVLRRLVRKGATLVADQDEARANTPDWLWHSWVAAHGEENTRAIACAHLQNPPLDFTVKDPTCTDQIATALDAQIMPAGTLRRTAGGAIADLPGFAAGNWFVQDMAAALPASLLISWARAANLDPASLTAIDLCAAPGGKTAQLAAAGVSVIAVDRSRNRLRQLTQNFERLGLIAKSITAEGATWQPAGAVDLVLLDAPCSATGTVRRHPDILHLKTPHDVTSLNQTQANLIRAAARMVRPGGVLVYAVCSLQPEEGPNIVAAFLDEFPAFTRGPVTGDEIGDLAQCITADGDLLTLPCHLSEQGGMDGFFAARLVRNS